MTRSHLFLFSLAVTSVFVGTTTFQTAVSAAPQAGSVIAGAPMLEPRSGHTATLLLNGKVLIAGGMRRNQDFYRSAELYDPATGKFQETGAMSHGRVGQVAVLLRSGKVLIAGGWIGGSSTTDSAELYDPDSGKFTVIGKMTVRRARPSATLLANGDVLLAGGDDHDGRDAAIASAEIFHADTLRFQPTGSLLRPRSSHTATLLNDGRVLIAGGTSGGLIAGAELYDPKSGTFSQTGSLITPRYKHTAGLLPDGRILIAGGSDERDWYGAMSNAEIYDPRSGKFTATSSLIESRFKLPDEAVQLASGQILISGGSKTVEVYDPASGRFLVASGQMNDKWHFMSETRLKDGRVMLAGGYPNSDQATAQTWIYRP